MEMPEQFEFLPFRFLIDIIMRQAPSANPTEPQFELIKTFPNEMNLSELIQKPEANIIINATTVKK